jgi:hypothetical protein
MPFIYPNNRLIVSTLDGWSDFIIYNQVGLPDDSGLPFRMRDGRLLRMRSGGNTDFLSSPKFIKCNLQSTNSAFPTAAHDAFYRGYIDESLNEGVLWSQWKIEQYNKEEADLALQHLAEDNFVPAEEVKLLVDAVIEFGQTAWNSDSIQRNQIKG